MRSLLLMLLLLLNSLQLLLIRPSAACLSSRRKTPLVAVPLPPPGQWSDWLSWQPCDSTCGQGVQIRERVCTGVRCDGPPEDAQICFNSECQTQKPKPSPKPLNGVVGPWTSWTSCSRSCGGGEMSRTRRCIRAPANGGTPCPPLREERVCDAAPCPEKGRFTPWSSWSACSKSCGVGREERSRVCLPPSHGGAPCSGDTTEHRSCHVQVCPPPVDGVWGRWQAWLRCSATCGTGRQIRVRGCDQPPPQNGGAECVGSRMEWRSCSGDPCAVDGRWGKWKPCRGQVCSPTPGGPTSCGLGSVQSCRECDNPKPQNGGRYCTGPPVRISDCWLTANCATDVVAKPENFRVVGYPGTDNITLSWQQPPYGLSVSKYSVFSLQEGNVAAGLRRHDVAVRALAEEEVLQDYSLSLDQLTRGRSYTLWVQAFGERKSATSESIKFQIGRYDGQWGAWGHYSSCSVTCGRGRISAVRPCNSPTPSSQPRGQPCPGSNTRSTSCRARQRYC